MNTVKHEITEDAEGFYWVLEKSMSEIDWPQDGPFDTHQEAEESFSQYIAKEQVN